MRLTGVGLNKVNLTKVNLTKARQIVACIWASKITWAGVTVGLTGLYYVTLLVAPIVKFRQWPNYVNSYNWLRNVETIVASTPSWSDTAMIIKDEWLLEVGYMNYDFGIGLAQWSLFIAPAKVAGVFVMSALVATLLVLLRSVKTCGQPESRLWANKVTGGFGAGIAALTSVSLSWVVCCSTPTWVVGLAMMGLGVSTSLWLEPIGIWLNTAGLVLLLLAICRTAKTLPDTDQTFKSLNLE